MKEVYVPIKIRITQRIVPSLQYAGDMEIVGHTIPYTVVYGTKADEKGMINSTLYMKHPNRGLETVFTEMGSEVNKMLASDINAYEVSLILKNRAAGKPDSVDPKFHGSEAEHIMEFDHTMNVSKDLESLLKIVAKKPETK